MHHHYPHFLQASMEYAAQQEEAKHQREQGEIQAAWDEYWSEKNAERKEKEQSIKKQERIK